MGKKRKHTKEDIQRAVDKSLSIAQVCREIGLVPAGGNYKTVKLKLQEFNISTDHFTGQGWNVGERFNPFGRKIELEDVLIENSTYASTSRLKRRLIESGLKKPICEKCSKKKWLGKPIPLELDHINGVNNDHRIENLRILCPNCHALTPTYRGKNKTKS